MNSLGSMNGVRADDPADASILVKGARFQELFVNLSDTIVDGD